MSKNEKAAFNSSEYIEEQLYKQYTLDVETKWKRKLDFTPFEESLKQCSRDFFESMHKKIDGKTVLEIQKAISSQTYSVTDLVLYYLNRIALYNDQYNAVLELNPDLLCEAEQLDDCLHDNSAKGLLFGLPVLLKDNIGTGDAMHTSAGAAVLAESFCDEDAQIVKNLRKEQALILGKTNLSEWANFMSTESSNGYSALGGQCKNAYGQFDVGGSSAGSGTAAALGLAALCIGTETAGSVIYPSSQNSVVGLKPSLGTVSQDRIIPISSYHDTAGPMTRYIADASLLYQVMSGCEAVLLSKKSLQNKCVGVVQNSKIVKYFRNDDEIILQLITQQLQDCGAKVIPVYLEEQAFDVDLIGVLKQRFRRELPEYLQLQRNEANSLTLRDICQFNAEDDKTRAPFNQEILQACLKDDISDEDIKTLFLQNREKTTHALTEVFLDCDMLVSLSNYLTIVYSSSGHPAITVPAGYRQTGEPVGMTLIGPMNADAELLSWAYAYEQQTQVRKNPFSVS